VVPSPASLALVRAPQLALPYPPQEDGVLAPKVLVIDDDVAIREAVADALSREGYEILFSPDGNQALQMIDDCPPDVIVLDLRMPGMDGFEFLKRFDPRSSTNCPVIVLTAYADPDAVKACHDAGVGTLLEKPFRLQELREAVRNAVIANNSSPHERIQEVQESKLEPFAQDRPLSAGAAEDPIR